MNLIIMYNILLFQNDPEVLIGAYPRGARVAIGTYLFIVLIQGNFNFGLNSFKLFQ